MTCASCGCHGGAWAGEVCLYRTADKRLDALWWRNDGPVLISAADVRLYDDNAVQPLTDVIIEPGRVSIVVHADDLDLFEDGATLEVLASDEVGIRALLVQAGVRITHSEASLPDGGSVTYGVPMRSYAYAGPAPDAPAAPPPLALARGRNGGNGNGNGNGNGGRLL